FSVGACVYNALSGDRLHKGRSEVESFLLAATKLAPSLARAAPDLPLEIISFVDKALAFEADARFQDAASMRAELRALLAASRANQLAPPRSRRSGGVVVRGNEMIEE